MEDKNNSISVQLSCFDGNDRVGIFFQLIKRIVFSSLFKNIFLNRSVWLAARLSDSVSIFRLEVSDKIMPGRAHHTHR